MCGDGSKGQLGIGDCEQAFSLQPVASQTVKKVACGEFHTMILSQSQDSSAVTVKVCGANDKY